MANVVKSGNSKATANSSRSLLSSIFRLAVRNGRVAVNPCSQVERMKECAGRVRFLTDAEERAATPGDPGPASRGRT